MITLGLRETAALLEGELRDCHNGGPFSGLGSDSRKPLPGALFVALRGPNFNGHDFVDAARRRGARAALVERWVASELAQIRVADTRLALGRLGAAWRKRFTGTLVAVTGSNGKTTVKEMIAACLSQRGSVLATSGNLNNDIGVPLTLAQLGDEDYAVIEMGANHAGEIAYLSALARPQVAVITNAGPAHLEGFGDIVGVARAKGEIFQGLAPNGVGVINADDAFADYWRSLMQKRTIADFALQRSAWVSGQLLDTRTNTFRLLSTGEGVTIRLPLPGRHAIYNALAAAAVARALGVGFGSIRCALESMVPVEGRLQPLPGPFGSTFINDTYNANPASLAAALQVLTETAERRWLVLGDMAELGEEVQALHSEAGRAARSAGVERLFAIGKYSSISVTAFGAGGCHFDTPQALDTALGEQLAASINDPPTVLFKGSRSMRMESIVEQLQADSAIPMPAPERGIS